MGPVSDYVEQHSAPLSARQCQGLPFVHIMLLKPSEASQETTSYDPFVLKQDSGKM